MKTANLQVPAPSGDVGKVFATYPAPARKLLLAIRGMLYETADSLPEAGRIGRRGRRLELTPATHSKSARQKAGEEACATLFRSE